MSNRVGAHTPRLKRKMRKPTTATRWSKLDGYTGIRLVRARHVLSAKLRPFRLPVWTKADRELLTKQSAHAPRTHSLPGSRRRSLSPTVARELFSALAASGAGSGGQPE
jgi:hypothetical protein